MTKERIRGLELRARVLDDGRVEFVKMARLEQILGVMPVLVVLAMALGSV